jgi:hypothetical protein
VVIRELVRDVGAGDGGHGGAEAAEATVGTERSRRRNASLVYSRFDGFRSPGGITAAAAGRSGRGATSPRREASAVEHSPGASACLVSEGNNLNLESS